MSVRPAVGCGRLAVLRLLGAAGTRRERARSGLSSGTSGLQRPRAHTRSSSLRCVRACVRARADELLDAPRVNPTTDSLIGITGTG